MTNTWLQRTDERMADKKLLVCENVATCENDAISQIIIICY